MISLGRPRDPRARVRLGDARLGESRRISGASRRIKTRLGCHLGASPHRGARQVGDASLDRGGARVGGALVVRAPALGGGSHLEPRGADVTEMARDCSSIARAGVRTGESWSPASERSKCAAQPLMKASACSNDPWAGYVSPTSPFVWCPLLWARFFQPPASLALTKPSSAMTHGESAPLGPAPGRDSARGLYCGNSARMRSMV